MDGVPDAGHFARWGAVDWRRRARLGLVIGVSSVAVSGVSSSELAVTCGMAASVAIPAQNASSTSPRSVPEIPFSALKPDATFSLELRPGAAADGEGIWIPLPSTSAVVRVDVKKNALDPPIGIGKPPCASLVVAFDSVWVPSCEAGTMSRIDIKSGNVSAASPIAIANPEGGVAVAGGSVWVVTDAKGVVARIDPATNAAVAEAYVAAKPDGVAAAEDAVWVTSAAGDLLTRINAQTNVIVDTVKVGPRPGPVVIGEGGVWTLNRGDGSVTRVDPKTNKAVTTIAVGAGFANGALAVGEGSVWLSAPGVPIVRIDPRNNRVVQRFVGEGGGAILVAHGSVWVSVGPKLTWRLDPKLIAAMRP
jgi:virginiamycin B lyase